MRVTTADIQNWVKAHPASAGKVRKFARYYMPTTLKLLRTYADVKDQQGEAAGNIRQEIGGILTTDVYKRQGWSGPSAMLSRWPGTGATWRC